MPDIYGPFDGSPWSQAQWYRYSPTWAPSGVVGSAASATSPSAGSFGLTVSGMTISVALGRAVVYGAGYERTSTAWTATIPANTSSNPRMDALVLRRDLSAKTVLPTVLLGTPAATPVAPTRQMDETGQWDLPLHTWITPASSGAPLTSVVDNRVWIDTQSSNYVVAGAGGGQILAYGTMTGSQTGTASFARVIGGLNIAPTLAPGRVYEYELTSFTGSASNNLAVQVRALAGATAPTSATGTAIAGQAIPQWANVGFPGASSIGKFTVGTAGAYSISPFISSSASSVFQLSPNSPAITVVVRDAGPSASIALGTGSTLIAVP
jgi:hypothetical protein